MISRHPFIPAAVVASSLYLARSRPRQNGANSPQLNSLTEAFSSTRWAMHINELPVELLMSIFETAHEDAPPSLRVPALLVVSHVCRRWRQAALQSERLWSCLPLTSAIWTDECLSRCRTAPLDIHARYSAWQANRSADVLELLASELRRTGTLCICVPEDSATSSRVLPKVMDILNTHDAPLLGTLLLSFRRYTAREIILRAYTPSKPLFLGHSLEMLRNVAFVDAIVSLECLALFPNLRSLELINSMVWHNTAEFLAFCRTFPRLEELVFIYDRGAASARQYPVTITIDDEKAPARCMPMRGLKKFVHHAPPVHMARTFALLDIPTTATVMLSYDDDRWTHGPVEAALDAPVDGWPGVLANLLDAAPVNGLAGAMIDPLDAFPILQTALHAHFADASGQRFPTLLFDGRELCAAITENDGEASLPSYFHMTIPYIGAQSVETMLGNSPVFLKTPSLIVKPPHPSNRNSIPGLLADEVYHVFRLFSGVARLTLHSYALYRFIEHYKRVGPKPAFPNLESLRIVDMNLAQDINDPDRPRLVMNDLLCALFKPGRVSDWLEYIVFERCTINEADAALLRKGVDTELNVEGAELEFLTCTMVTDEMFAREYKEDE